MFKQFDKDGDGKLTKEEASQLPEQVFNRMDSNQDGAIDASELAKLSAGAGRPPGQRGAPGKRPGGEEQ
jgi:Ca2+-binding EF-hand superfamily protein